MRRTVRMLITAVLVIPAPGCDGTEGPPPSTPVSSVDDPREPSTHPPADPSPPRSPAAELRPWSDAWILADTDRFLDDRAFHRAQLEASLTNPDNMARR